MRASFGFTFGAGLIGAAMALTGCNNPPPATSMTDGGDGTDGGGRSMCPTTMIPDFEQQMGACCYRRSQADQLSAPELRLRSLHLTAPEGSALVSPTTGMLLNSSLANETFNWLFRGMATGNGDGPITIETGYGTRDSATGIYSFSTDAEYAPVTLNGTITGETITTEPDDGVLTVPVFDPTGTMLQVKLALHNVEVVTSTFSENRSCIGSIGARYQFTTAATLQGYLLLSESQTTTIDVDPIHAQLCTLIASNGFTDPASGPYCDQPRSSWDVLPDSLCATGAACVLDPGDGSVCSHDGTGATPCNAWQLVSDFAAVGIDIAD